MGKPNEGTTGEGTTTQQQGAKKEKQIVVEVICEGHLGTSLLKNGDKTSDPEYVALLDDTRGLVRLVK